MDELPPVDRGAGDDGYDHSSAPWPYRLLDVTALRRSGWRPSALREFVLKVHQRCNLACDYCYVYTLADQTWRLRPSVMRPEVVDAAAARIAAHATAHRLPEIAVILHGGEPLLAGSAHLIRIAETVRRPLPATTTARLAVQTNGTLLDETMLAALHEHDIRVGVSLDGTGPDHDRHRRYTDGRGSHAAVRRALSLLSRPPYRDGFAGLLATIDPETDPVASYESMLEYRPPTLDFLLPHANWSAPHPARARGGAPFGDWLIGAFERWYGAPRKEVRIPLFEEIINLALGGQSGSGDVGLGRAAVVVVETDGAIEQVDSLKSAYHGAAATGLSVLTDSFDSALTHPGMVARQIGVLALADNCRNCAIHEICGGGQYAHRYRAGTGFRNPSVYCRDLARLILHVRQRLGTDLHALRHPRNG